jgi:type II secretory pathway pseudopilin PulG
MMIDPGAVSAGIGLIVGVAAADVALRLRRSARAAREREMREAAVRARKMIQARAERRARIRSGPAQDHGLPANAESLRGG